MSDDKKKDYTESDLHSLISSLREILLISKDSLAKPQSNDVKVEDLGTETIKLIKLIYAHTTKIGIAFRPPVSMNAAYSQLKEISQFFLLLISVVGLYEQDTKYSKFFVYEITSLVGKLLTAYIHFLTELEALNFTEKKQHQEEDGNDLVDGRLMSIGIIWDLCDNLQSLVNGGNLELLKKKIKLSLGLVEDASAEFAEWIEDPQKLDDSDPFGLGLDDEEEEEEDDEEEDHLDPSVLILAKKWQSKLKLVKLLLSSLVKSLPSEETNLKGTDFDIFNTQQDKLIEMVDDLVAGFFMYSSLYELESTAKQITNQCVLLIELVKGLNEGNEEKVKWLKIWLERFMA